ncbi:MAG TPA: DedA family protein [Mycobacteriales bacterium]|nr:DedA family protein [Mycobacteriales bacterium]HVU60752.1 DedA family protein [Mycobacteriales bacterium]
MFDHFTHLVAEAAGWAYVVIFVFAMLDVVLPIVPSETAVITAGVVAAAGDLFLPLVIVSAAAGAFAGDTTVYTIGSHWGEQVRRRFLSGEKGARSVEWASGLLDSRGGELIVIGRFIPGGRTAVTLTAGTTHFGWRRFVRAEALAAALWALYAALLGYFGGKAFEHTPWAGLLVALGVALLVSGLTELVRFVRARRRRTAA